MKNYIRSKFIPFGEYCYEVDPEDQTIRFCPFWYGIRPDGGCMLYGWDPGLGDACKACGTNVGDEYWDYE